jgi:hypothetical protein
MRISISRGGVKEGPKGKKNQMGKSSHKEKSEEEGGRK